MVKKAREKPKAKPKDNRRRRPRPSGVKIVVCVHHRRHHHHHHRRFEMGTPATVNVGHVVTCTYTITDQNGNPMLVQPPLDSPAAWTDAPSPAGADTNAVSADGTTDVVSAAASGSDTVGVTVIVGGSTFTDSVLITISPAPQVASGVVIDTVVS